MSLDRERIKKLASAVREVLDNAAKAPPELLKDNFPKGLPEMGENRDVTDPDYPTNDLKDVGFHTKQIISGTGSGPVLGDGEEEQGHL